MKYLLDTHVWLFWNGAQERISPRVRALLSAPSRYEELLLSAISPWELAKLVQKRRFVISCAPEDWIRQALEMPKLRLIPLSPEIAYRSTVLPAPFHNDPADQIIVATAREEGATLLTADDLIRSYPHVQSLW